MLDAWVIEKIREESTQPEVNIIIEEAPEIKDPEPEQKPESRVIIVDIL